MANYNDKWREFFDDDAADQVTDETKIFDSSSLEPYIAEASDVPDLPSEKKKSEAKEKAAEAREKAAAAFGKAKAWTAAKAATAAAAVKKASSSVKAKIDAKAQERAQKKAEAEAKALEEAKAAESAAVEKAEAAEKAPEMAKAAEKAPEQVKPVEKAPETAKPVEKTPEKEKTPAVVSEKPVKAEKPAEIIEEVPEKKEKRKKKRKEDTSDLPVGFRKDRHTGIVGGILYFIFVVGISALLAGFGWLAATDVLALGKPEEAVEVTIPDQYDTDSVADILFDKGLIKYKSLFKFYTGLSSTPLEEKVQPGTYKLYTNFDYRAIVYGLTPAGAERIYLDVTIPEGYTLRQIFKLLDTQGVCKEDKLWDAAANYDFNYDFLDKSTLGDKQRLEGFLFPDTYEFYLSQNPEGVIKKFLSNFNNRYNDNMREMTEEKGFTIKEIVTIASMIEREAVGDSDRATISSVIHNRLESSSFPYLQFDSTINYIISYTGEEFSTEIDSPYNTYKYEGLPIGPIANPGIAAIRAALEPEDTGYYYYALGKDGEHHFFRSSDGFLGFINSDEYAG